MVRPSLSIAVLRDGCLWTLQSHRAQALAFASEELMDEFLTVDEAANELRVDRRTVYRCLKQGKLHGQKLGPRWRIRRSALTAYLNARRSNVT
jgi:excisionase family DNA binding protein